MRRLLALLILLAAGLVASQARAAAGPVCDAAWTDPIRGRDIPVRIRMPAGDGRAPVILFSHGLGGSREGGAMWGEAWARAGFAVIHLQHPGSDRLILGQGGLVGAMSAQQLVARAKDVSFVLDELGRRYAEGACDLSRIDLSRVGMSGHSFGAHTTQAVAGQVYPSAGGRSLADPRITAAIAFSPSPPRQGSAEEAFERIRIPFFSITGTEDAVPLTPRVRPIDREGPFRAMPPGGKYLLVLDGANHMVFNGQDDSRFGHGAPSQHVAQVVEGTTTLFWRWTLLGDEGARRRLDARPPSLAAADRLERR